MVRSNIRLNKDEVQIYDLRVKIDDIPYFLERCGLVQNGPSQDK